MIYKFILITTFTFFLNAAFGQLFINEIQASNDITLADNFSEYDDWIEIYNAGNAPVNLAGYYLSDNTALPLKWQVPTTNATLTTAPAGGYLIFWADNETMQGANHINFKLSSGGESLILTAPDGITLVDSLSFPAVNMNNSYGRSPDGSGNLAELNPASPLTTNNNSLTTIEAPVILLPSGTYTSSQTLGITADAGLTIYYTLDGSTPNASSNIFTTPFAINATTSIKAIAVDAQNNQSKVTFGSFLFNPTTALPILHIAIDPFYLYDDSLGMYVIGTNGVPGPCHSDDRNWSQDWRYNANVVLYEKDGTIAFEEGCGLEISGGCSRNSPKKSFNVSFRSQYGSNKIDYKLFDTKEETEWHGFKVRRAKLQNRTSDNFNQKLIENQLDIDSQASRPVALYLNNQYWGLYFIKDRMNKGYVKTHHPKVDADSIDLIKFPNADGALASWVVEDVKEGTNEAYQSLDTFMMQNPLSIQSNYEYVKTKYDINSYLDYFCSQIYYNTGDWPANNVKIWRPKDQSGKWRWMMFDIESSHWNGGAANTDYLSNFFNSNDPNRFANYVATRPYRLLLENDEFKHEFIQRINTYSHTLWDTLRVVSVLNDFKAEIRPEIQSDYNRWITEETNSLDSPTWELHYDNLATFFKIRPDSVRATIDYTLNASGRVELSFNTTATTNGKVHLHTNYFELPHNYTGIYHKDVPLDIHAIPNPGYRFSHWLETGNTNSTLYQAFATNQTLTPIFEPALDLVINEIHYNPLGTSEAEEFIELYNPDDKAKPLQGYRFDNGVDFTFPENTVINPQEYIVIAKDASLYNGNSYQVFQWECGSLNNDGEMVFFSSPSNVIDSIRYNDNSNWDQNADGLGHSLALINHTTDNSQPTAWASQVTTQISPGAENEFCAPITNNTTVANISCNGANDGFIANQLTGGTAPFSYSWNNGITTPTIGNLPPATYTVTISDFYNCSFTETFTITEPPLFSTTSITSTEETLYQANDGTASINVSGGIQPYAYNWSNSTATASINNLAPGNYSVDVTDANGCQISKSVVINGINCNPISVNISVNNETCEGQSDGLLIASNFSNGTAPYSILWSTGSTGTVANNLTTGSYTLNITDNNGCPFQQNYTIAADNTIQASFNINDVSSATVTDGSIQTVLPNGAGPYSYSWSNGSNNQNLNNVGEGIYSVTVSDANGCSEFFDQLVVSNACIASIAQLNNPAINSQVYQVANFIQSNGMVNTNEQVSFKAGDYIELIDNFEVIIGAEFEAVISGCQ